MAAVASMGGVDRAMRVYDAAIRAIEDRGHTVEIQKYKRDGYDTPQYRTAVLIDGETVEIVVQEVTRRVERGREGPHDSSPKYDLVPSGNLAISIRNELAHRRFRWADTPKRTLESQLGEFIHGLAVAAIELKEQRRAHEEYHRKQVEAQRREWEEADRRRLEAGRVRALQADIDRMHTARWTREYLKQLKPNVAAHPDAETPDVHSWLLWVESYAERIDPFVSHAVVPKDPGRTTAEIDLVRHEPQPTRRIR